MGTVAMRFAQRRHNGFTLIEVLTVLVIIAVLAATIIPQIYPAGHQRKIDSLSLKARTLRAQILSYQEQHQGVCPTVQGNSLPQLTRYTDLHGNTSEVADPTKPFGPYISGALPNNPFGGRNRVVEVRLHGQPPTTVADNDGGWQYDPTTGDIWPNNPEYFAPVRPPRADLASSR
jgi:prepilin-type N-terminal cleavage/methylation domain-containing protein